MIMDNAFLASLQQQLQQANQQIQQLTNQTMQANQEIARLRASHIPTVPINPLYPPQHLRPSPRPTNPFSSTQPAYTHVPFNNGFVPQQSHPGFIPATTIQTTIPVNGGETNNSARLNGDPEQTESTMNVRIKLLEEQNEKMLALLTKLPGAVVPV
ncbi:hypothetical protein OSB04_006614 [Centaurea solstitialis]|uniref:Uncharacterized protein n=1 Tax=Centaurea solstitialis TaxID=347529 RepID=A0AA38WS42_9ASTR|nr:hypothetical protein OSB04_006614 [Centaurea solstitialis]